MADSRAMSRWYMEQAKDEMQRGNRLRASEKAWEALAQQLKAIGAARGWRHASHDHVREIGVQIGYEYNSVDILGAAHQGKELHTNSYDSHLSRCEVSGMMIKIESVLDELETLRTAPPRVYTVKKPGDAHRIQFLTGQPVNVGDSSPTGFVLRNPAVGPDGNG